MLLFSAVATLGGLGLAFGFLLAAAARHFAVQQDERTLLILNMLPGANCGGCGYAGCHALASAIACGQAQPNACPVGSVDMVKGIASLMGVHAHAQRPQFAVVLCNGKDGCSPLTYEYEGLSRCAEANRLGSGPKACPFACIGFGDCVRACPFGALFLEDGVAKVNPEKCRACGKCVVACPKGLIAMLPKKRLCQVLCSCQGTAAEKKMVCTVGCIGCGRCVKVCPRGAISLQNRLAVIEADKCTGCGLCVQTCPKKSICIVM